MTEQENILTQEVENLSQVILKIDNIVWDDTRDPYDIIEEIQDILREQW